MKFYLYPQWKHFGMEKNMANNVNDKIENEIDQRLKRIMQQRNIHNEDDIRIEEDSENVVMPEDSEQEIEDIKRSPRTNKLHPLNQIIYGAPGTGKTYSTVEYACAILENRPVNEAIMNEDERKALMDRYQQYMKEGKVVFTTFHQSYGYEEFVQGIRPVPENRELKFEVSDGIFKKIADEAIRDQTNNYVIIIDEINRGNISKIFGELITLIEEDKRWGELNQMMVSLPLKGKFAVPNNLFVIGTMNSADKSISLIDAALRRRFEFIEMAPKYELIGDSMLKNVLISLNTYLKRELRSTDLLIGHSCFINRSAGDLPVIMNRNVIPLLYEYFYDDEAKVRKALDCLSGTDFEPDSEAAGRIRIKKKGD